MTFTHVAREVGGALQINELMVSMRDFLQCVGWGFTNLYLRQQCGPHNFAPTKNIRRAQSAAALFAAAAHCCGLSRTVADICSPHAGFVGVLAHKAMWNNEKALRLSELVCFTGLIPDYVLKNAGLIWSVCHEAKDSNSSELLWEMCCHLFIFCADLSFAAEFGFA